MVWFAFSVFILVLPLGSTSLKPSSVDESKKLATEEATAENSSESNDPLVSTKNVTESGGNGLLAIARLEAAKARELLGRRVLVLLSELEAASDPSHGYVRSRIDELVTIGSAALPSLMTSLDGVGELPGRAHRALCAAHALGEILQTSPIPEVEDALIERLSSPEAPQRAMAARALGFAKKTNYLQRIELLSHDPSPEVQNHAIQALGDLDDSRALATLLPALESSDSAVARSAARAVMDLDTEVPASNFAALLADAKADEALLTDIVAFLGKYGNADSLALILPFLAEGRPASLRRVTLEASRDIALRHKGRAAAKVIITLKPMLDGSAYSPFIEAIAFVLNELGDPSGLERVLDEENQLLKINPKNHRARFTRAEKYYRFGQYDKAITDCKESIRNDRSELLSTRSHYLMAACYAALDNYRSAKGVLQKTGRSTFRDLLAIYPELNKMAADEKYASLFQ